MALVEVTITADNKLFPGHNNAGSLVRITSIVDANSVAFVEPLGIPHYRRGLERPKADGSRSRSGVASSEWLFSWMSAAQWIALRDTYEGLVTVRLALGSVTYANFNAALVLPDTADLTYNNCLLQAGVYKGPGYEGVRVGFVDLEAL